MERITLFADRYRLREQANWRIRPELEAQQLKALVGLMDRAAELVAIIHEDDHEAQQAYRALGYTIYTMNGDRSQVLPDMLASTAFTQSERALVIVSDDAAFNPLIETAMQQARSVQLWTVHGERPDGLPRDGVSIRPLEELFPAALMQAAPAAAVWMDIENVIYGLIEQGRKPDVKTLIEAVKRVTQLPIQEMHAYGDFGCLREALGYDVQRELEENGVHTVYQLNRRGKNSADMCIATGIQQALMKDELPDTVVLVSGDRDFGPLIEILHASGKQVLVVACRGSLSQELQRQADAVYFLENDFALSAEIQPVSDHDGKVFMLKFLRYLQQHGWKWTYQHKLPANLCTPALEQCLTSGALLRDGNRLRPNYGHPLTRAAACAVWWLPDRIRYLLEKKGLPYVDTPYLARGMALDKACQEAGLGETYEDAQSWLAAAAEAGLILRKVMPHPRTPEHKITTWQVF